MTTYTFVALNPQVTAGLNKLYVEAFMTGLNLNDFVKHPVTPDKEHVVDESGWSYGLPPRYNDGRVTTRRTAWVYAKKGDDMPDGACAMVYFTTDGAPVGYLTKETK